LPDQSRRFFCSWYSSRTQRPADDVIQDLMSGKSSWRIFTHHGMETLGIHMLTTRTAVWDRLNPTLMPTATRTASSSNRRPQLAIGRTRSQFPLCGAREAKNLAFCDGSTKEFSMSAGSAWSPGLSQKDFYRATDSEVAQLTWTSMSPEMSLLGRGIVPITVSAERGCLPPRPERQPSNPQATMFD